LYCDINKLISKWKI